MHKTATGTVVARTDLPVNIDNQREGVERIDLEEGFAELGFVFWMTGNGPQFRRRMSELAFVPERLAQVIGKNG